MSLHGGAAGGFCCRGVDAHLRSRASGASGQAQVHDIWNGRCGVCTVESHACLDDILHNIERLAELGRQKRALRAELVRVQCQSVKEAAKLVSYTKMRRLNKGCVHQQGVRRHSNDVATSLGTSPSVTEVPPSTGPSTCATNCTSSAQASDALDDSEEFDFWQHLLDLAGADC